MSTWWLVVGIGSIPAYLAYHVYQSYVKVTTKRKKPVLHALKISHYVEKARWTLDLLGEEYEERYTYAVLGLLLTGKTLPALELDPRTMLGDSDDILLYLRGKHPKGNFLSVELNNEEKLLLGEMDRFGVHVRRFLYGKLLQKSPHIVAGLWKAGTSSFASATGDWLLFPIAKFFLVNLLAINPRGIDRSHGEMDKVLDKFDKMLSDGREYLNGKQLSELDIVFCALVAPLVMEPKYGGGKLPQADELDADTRAAIMPYQDRPFAKHCHKIYQKHR